MDAIRGVLMFSLFQPFVLLALMFQTGGTQNPQENRMVELATAEEPLVHSAVIAAPRAEVWKAWTTSEGIRKWMVPNGEVELKIGGKFRTSYTKDSDLTGPDVIENTILAYDPGKMISFRNTKSPDRFPFKTAMEKVWTVVYLDDAEGQKTRVTVRMIGFDPTEESQKMKSFFRQGNQATLDSLSKLFAPKPEGI